MRILFLELRKRQSSQNPPRRQRPRRSAPSERTGAIQGTQSVLREHFHAERGNEFKCFDSVGLRQENEDVSLRRVASRLCLLVDKCSKYT